MSGITHLKPKPTWLLYPLLALLAALGLFAVPSVWAFESRTGDTVVIGPNEEINDDLYVFANRLKLQGTVNGDLVFFGQSLALDGVVAGDLIAGGQHLAITGDVRDDARLFGYAMELDGELGDDLVGFGFSLEHGAGSAIGGDLVFFGYQAMLNGEVAGDVEIAGGAVEVQGTIAGNAAVDVGGSKSGGEGRRMPPGFTFVPGVPSVPAVRPGLTVGDSARIGGNLAYTATEQIAFEEEAVEGETSFSSYEGQPRRKEKPPRSPVAVVLRWTVRRIRQLTTLLLAGALMLWLVPGWTRKMESIVRTKPLPSLGWGFVSLLAFAVGMIAIVIASGLLAILFGIVTLGELAGRFVALGGLVLGTAGFGFSIAWSYVTRVIVSLLLGHLIFELFKSPMAERLWLPGLVGLLIFVALLAIPVAGWFIGALAAVIGLGALWIWAREQLRERRNKEV